MPDYRKEHVLFRLKYKLINDTAMPRPLHALTFAQEWSDNASNYATPVVD